MCTHNISLLCLHPQLSGSRNRGCSWPWPSALLLPSVLSTAPRFANRSDVGMRLCPPHVSTELVGCATAVPGSSHYCVISQRYKLDSIGEPSGQEVNFRVCPGLVFISTGVNTIY